MTQLDKSIIDLISTYPKFDDGRIDYSDVRVCPVVNCVVRCGEMVLLTRRGEDVIAYPNTINGISGFIDEIKPLEDVVYQELSEEVGLERTDVKELKIFPEIIQTDEDINREWHVYPALAVVDEMFEPEINWENKEAVWMTIEAAKSQEFMPGFREVLKVVLGQSYEENKPLGPTSFL